MRGSTGDPDGDGACGEPEPDEEPAAEKANTCGCVGVADADAGRST